MTNPLDQIEEPPLDPAVARIQKRLQRLVLIAGSTLGVGILAVFAAIVYRLFTYEPQTAPAMILTAPLPALTRSDLGLSPQARLVSTSLDGPHLLLTYDDDGSIVALVYDLEAAAVVKRLHIAPD